jgi:hypothetical protein
LAFGHKETITISNYGNTTRSFVIYFNISRIRKSLKYLPNKKSLNWMICNKNYTEKAKKEKRRNNGRNQPKPINDCKKKFMETT